MCVCVCGGGGYDCRCGCAKYDGGELKLRLRVVDRLPELRFRI